GRSASGSAAQRNAPFVFLSVVDAINPRKNLRGLLTAYGLLRKMTARPVHLLLKQYRLDMDFSGIEGVSSITGDLSEGRMAALYGSCDAYVSAHHSEGWGLGLSSAMAFGKPVIATGYSGNMQFMNNANSLPVPYSLVPVSQEMCKMVPLFTSEMRWAEPDLAAMAGLMRRAAEGRLDPGLPGQAAAIVRSFGFAGIMKRLEELLAGS
ncbi:glycosyltransferase, partial [Desulfovibrio sp. OttesenSCG-928-C06]|nr:glycosyltransferase [Desulfovibrio sp. OttesenSCG-928-C06]